jgi:hypothetical protein
MELEMKHAKRLPALLVICAIGAMTLTGGAPATQEPTTARARMHQAWAEHVAYMRHYIISSMAGLPDAQAVSNRLQQNADDVGRTLQPYYGDDAAQKLTRLMRDHATLLTEMVQVVSTPPTTPVSAPAEAKRGAASSDRTTTNQSTDRNMGGNTGAPGSTGGVGYDRNLRGLNETEQERFESSRRRLDANGKNIAAFLGGVNPNVRKTDVERVMQMQTNYVVDMISARVNGDWQADIQAFDRAIAGMFQFSSSLMQSIERQFPDRFAQAKASGR